MNTQQLSIVHRLPQSYRWLAGFAGSRVEPIPQNGAQNENSLVALKLLSPDGEKAWPVMHKSTVPCWSAKVNPACSLTCRMSLPPPVV